MHTTRIKLLLALVVLLASSPAAWSETTNEHEAMTIARNYVKLILAKDGAWGPFDTAMVTSIQELKRGERTLGYFCPVSPRGFVVVSLHKELAPVKAYSNESNLNPDTNVGMMDVIKVFLERPLNAVEKDLGAPIDATTNFEHLLETNYRPAWDRLARADFQPEVCDAPPRSRSVGMNYREGEVLLRSAWHQHAPYNDWCPYPVYWDPELFQFVEYQCTGTSNGRTVVGCVATAAAQIMRHWEWPPYGEGDGYDDAYDWNNMCDAYWDDGAGWWVDQDQNPVTWEQFLAAGELSYEVAYAAEMEFGCDGSSAFHANMETAYEENFRYDDSCNIKERCCDIWGDPYYTASEWYNLMRSQFNVNRPVQYGIPGHSLVADGWKLEEIGDDYYWYHMNYGWGGGTPDETEWDPYSSSNAWFALDAHPGGDTEEDEIIRTILPDPAIGGSMAGSYGAPSPINVRYFDLDTEGANATFAAGIWFQALEADVLIRGTGTGGDTVTFNGAPGAESRFYFSADFDTYTRIRITDGAIRLRGGGEMCIH